MGSTCASRHSRSLMRRCITFVDGWDGHLFPGGKGREHPHKRPHTADFLVDHGRKDDIARQGDANLLENSRSPSACRRRRPSCRPSHEFQPRRLSGPSLLAIPRLAAQKAAHNVPNFRIATPGSAARVGANAPLELGMPRRSAIANLIVSHAQLVPPSRSWRDTSFYSFTTRREAQADADKFVEKLKAILQPH